jgi:hypothetical protein
MLLRNFAAKLPEMLLCVCFHDGNPISCSEIKGFLSLKAQKISLLRQFYLREPLRMWVLEAILSYRRVLDGGGEACG